MGIPLLDYGVEPDTRRPFLVLDWGGTDLKASIDKSNIRNWDAFYDLFGKGILEALAFAHSRGVVHRDLKAADLLRTETGKSTSQPCEVSVRLRSDCIIPVADAKAFSPSRETGPVEIPPCRTPPFNRA